MGSTTHALQKDPQSIQPASASYSGTVLKFSIIVGLVCFAVFDLDARKRAFIYGHVLFLVALHFSEILLLHKIFSTLKY